MKVIRIPNISGVRAWLPDRPSPIDVRIAGGRAKWTEETGVLSIKVHLCPGADFDEEFADYAETKRPFRLMITGAETTTEFPMVALIEYELRSGTANATGGLSLGYFLKLDADCPEPPTDSHAAEQGAAGQLPARGELKSE